MAEAIGLAASIIGLIQLTGKLVSLGYEYIGGVKDAPKDLRQLVDELHSLAKVLLILQDYARDDRTLQTTALQTFNGQNGPLPGCALELTRLRLKLEPSQGVRGKINALVWPLKERETYKYIEQIERHKSLFSLALVADQLALSRSINEYVRGTSYIVRTLEGESLAQKTVENRCQVLDWLYPEDFDKKHTEISGRRQENTTNWVFEMPEFKNWLKDQPDFRILWGCGIPGAGKTFISSSVIDYLATQQLTMDYGIAYIYFDYVERDQQKPIRILASLVKQLLHQASCIPKEIQSIYDAGESPSFEDLWIALVIISGLFGQVFLIFDALDECDQNQRKDLLPLFHRLGGYGISMFLTSRPHLEDIQGSFEDVQGSFKDVTKIKISAQEEDIRVYIQQKIESNPRAKRLVGQGKCEDKIVSGLVDCTKGMFILVRFHIDYICQQTTVRKILSKLESLKNLSSEERPLDPTYDRAMDIIHKQPKDCTELALRTLLWLVKARRTLTVDELREAVSIEPNQRSFNEYDLPDRKTLLDVCASLVTIDENSNTIGLAHYTIQEYLLRNRIYDEFGSRLALGCITFLSFDIFAQYDLYENLLLLHPFVRYAVQYLSSHLKDCDESLSVEVLLKLLKNRDNFWSYKKLFDYVVEKDQWYSYSIPLYSRLPLHIASALGHRTLVYRLLNEDPSIISAPGKYKLTALHEAVLGGNEQVVQLLLEKGAKASPSDIRGKTPLHYAARSGNEVVAHLLLGGAADISSFDEQRRTALHEATEKGHRPMVHLLLENGADISASDTLYYAIRKRDCLMVQLLLERGADIEASDRGGNTALHLAVKNGDCSVVELLLEKGADIEASGGGGCTALHFAALERDHSLVELLLEKGADIEASEKGGYTALHIAAQKGDRSLVKLLLEKGADTEASDYKGRNALYFAALQGDRSLVELLLEKGADIEASDRKGRNVLLLAAQNRDRLLVKLLLEKGADTGASDGEGSTVLHLAAWQRDCSLVKLLLEKGADIEASEKRGYTALHIAAQKGGAQKGDRSLVKLLLEKGADTEASDYKGRNALHFAVLQGSRSLVELLLEKGADIEASDHKGRNALHLAARIRDRSLVELLLENGADIEAPDHKRRNALHVAAWKGNLLVVQLLLNRDADISLSDISGWTALHLAAYMGHNLVVSLLLDWGSDTASLNNSGQTALQVAVIQRHNAVIQLLSPEDCGDAAPLAPESPAAGGRTKRPAKDIEVPDNIEAPTLPTKRARPN